MTIRSSRILLAAVGFFDSAPCPADSGYAQLFGPEGKRIPVAEQKAVYSQLGLKLSKESFISEGCDPASYGVQIADLNSNGTPEIRVQGGNTSTSGMTGSSLWLFVKSAKGGYRANLGFPAAEWKALPQKSQGFPDLRFGGPGSCEAVWRWNGRECTHYRNVATAKGGCAGR